MLINWSECAQACAEKNRMALHLALVRHMGNWVKEVAPEGVVLAIIDAHPQVRRHAESS